MAPFETNALAALKAVNRAERLLSDFQRAYAEISVYVAARDPETALLRAADHALSGIQSALIDLDVIYSEKAKS